MMLDYIINLDRSLFILINSKWTAPWADQFFPFITDLHKSPLFAFIVVPLLIALFIWRRGTKKGLIIFTFLILSVAASDGFGNWALKKTVQRLRPGDTAGLEVTARTAYGGFSFVSNHATNMFCFASYTSAIFPPAAIPLYGLASLIAYSRVYNGVHFPLDVICGGLLGMFFGLLFATYCLKWIARIPQQGTKSA